MALWGGRAKAMRAMDLFFHDSNGHWAVTNSGPLHPELNNEPSIGAPWLYDFVGAPWKTQAVVREAMREIWTNRPDGISGNDDLGEMSSWYVWSAMGLYPLYPGRADLVVGSPLFKDIEINRPIAPIHIIARRAAADAPYVHGLQLDRQVLKRPWLDENFVKQGGVLDFSLSSRPDAGWGSAIGDAPPSYAP